MRSRSFKEAYIRHGKNIRSVGPKFEFDIIVRPLCPVPEVSERAQGKVDVAKRVFATKGSDLFWILFPVQLSRLCLHDGDGDLSAVLKALANQLFVSVVGNKPLRYRAIGNAHVAHAPRGCRSANSHHPPSLER